MPRRGSHYATRAAYLGALWVIAVTAWLAILGWTRNATLGETARFGALLFQVLTAVQLALFLFFSALSAASAIAKEKDRRTFVLLLMTDMSDAEIVVGKMLGSLLPILALLVGTVPFLILLLLLGGVGLDHVFQAVALTAATALAAGSLGGLIALWRDRTFQSLALTVLIMVMYLAAVLSLGGLPRLARLVGWEVSAELVGLAQQYLEPFHALLSVHAGLLQEQRGVPPAYIYSAAMLAAAAALNLWGMWKLRVWNPSGEPIMQRERPEDAVDRERELTEAEVVSQAGRVSVHAAPGVTRTVVGNPILWREIATRAYGRRPLMIKVAYALVLAWICYLALSPLAMEDRRGGYLAAAGLLPVAVLSLLLVTAQATTAITSERDTGALDLLLVTDLSPHEFIFGKILGIVWNTKEFLIPPLLMAGVYGFYECLATPPRGHAELSAPMNATALLCVVLTTILLLAFAAMLGIHVALRTPNSQVAIVHSLSTIFFLTVGTLVCIALILINRRFEYQWGSFIFFLIAGVGGLWYVLSGDRPTAALSCAAWFCPLAVLYSVMTLLVGRPGSQETADPFIPTLVIGVSFGFAIAAMLVPLLSEFDVAMGRTSGGAD